MPREFWITDRCLKQDLDLEFPDENHPLIRKFLDLRRQDPEPTGQQISHTRPRLLFKVDATQQGLVWRGASWHDRKNDVVFLVAAGQHRSGARDDFYAQLPQRLGKVYPEDADMEQVRLAAGERAASELRALVPELLEAARQNGVATRWLDHCRVRIETTPSGDIYGMRLDPRPGQALNVKVAAATAAVFAKVCGRKIAQSDRQWGDEPVPQGSYVFYF